GFTWPGPSAPCTSRSPMTAGRGHPARHGRVEVWWGCANGWTPSAAPCRPAPPPAGPGSGWPPSSPSPGPAMGESIGVLVVDDQALVRQGFAVILGAEPDIHVVGEAGDGATAVAMVAALRPDVVLMDVRMPGMDGIA